MFFVPPGYQRTRPIRRPKLGPWLGVIDQILEEDESRPKKQRHTAKRIYDRLKQEHQFAGGYTIVKDYVRQARLRHKEVFVPLAHPPGQAQADFGEALVVIAGQEQKAHFLCVDLPYSDDAFVVAFPAENTESFCEGHNQAFAYLAGCRGPSCTTTAGSPSNRSPGMGNVSPLKSSAGCNPITCSRPGSGVPARAMTRGTWKAWWATRGGTSWRRRHAPPVGRS